ncbi:hypothetical protein MASR2M48_14540 [Spirochaetota bacterium]
MVAGSNNINFATLLPFFQFDKRSKYGQVNHKCMYDSINKRCSVMDVIERFFPDDYEQSPESNELDSLQPFAPFTGSSHFAFCVHTD